MLLVVSTIMKVLNLYASPQFNHAVVGQLEEVRHIASIARHHREQGLAPICHTVAFGGHHNFTAQKVGSFKQVDL